MNKQILENDRCKECKQTIPTNERNTWLHNLLIAFDQLGNAFANGNPDTTISARVGYYANYNTEAPLNRRFWKFMERMIDFAWWPYERENHCRDAYKADPEDPYPSKLLAKIVLFTEALIFSIIVSVLLYFVWLISPKMRKRRKCKTCKQIIKPHKNKKKMEAEE